METEDIRDKPFLNGQDILQLNFIRGPDRFVFRRHFRMGLRSHIMEILLPADVAKETAGVIADGVRCFPRARPIRMLRIFRTRFASLAQAESEMQTVKLAARYLAPGMMAMSDEFLVSYRTGGSYSPLLCGLQEYVAGEVLDPWSPLAPGHLLVMADQMPRPPGLDPAQWRSRWCSDLRSRAKAFVSRIRQMILQERHVPDLAGVGNIFATAAGGVKLIDINNISRVTFDHRIRLDDRGYPVCDKSIEALALLEKKLLARPPGKNDPIYRIFLDPVRMKDVKRIEEAFSLCLSRRSSENEDGLVTA